MSISLSDFRKHMADYLLQLRVKKSPLFIGSRAKKEFVILPVPSNGDEGKSLFETYNSLEDKLIQSDYYT